MKPDTELTPIIFRKWRNGDILALFPETNEGTGRCSSYEHIGQHAGANYTDCLRYTTSANPAEYASLKAELEGVGYNLRIVKRRVRK